MKQKLRVFLTLLLCAVASVGWGDVYQKYSGEITEGDYIIVYNVNAMKAEVSNNRLGYATTYNSTFDQQTVTDGAIVWTIQADGDYYTLYNANKQQYAASTGTKNQARLESSISDKSRWTITESSGKYEFVNKANAEKEINANLRNNDSYGFACYATSTGGALTLYKKVEAAGPVDVNLAFGENFQVEVGKTATNTITGKPDDLTLSFESDKTNIATVDNNGAVTGVAEGTATITASWDAVANKYNAGSASYTVNVIPEKQAIVFEKVTSASQLVAGNEYILVSADNNTAMGSQNGSYRNKIDVTVSDNKSVSVTNEEVTVLTLGGSNGAWTLRTSDDNKYLCYPGNKNTLNVAESDTAVWVITDDFQVRHGNVTSRYIKYNSNSGQERFSTYVSGQQKAVLFMKQGGVALPSISADNINIEYNANSGSFTFSISNAVDGGTTTVAENVDWISNAELSDNTVSFTTTANEAATSREGIITLTYTYGDNQTVTKEVIVTQAGNPDATMTIAEVRAQATGEVNTKGIVTSCVGTTGYIQDATAAICVYGTSLTVGDEIKVSGTLSTYKGLLEITSPEVTVISQNNTVNPEVMTIAQVNASTNQGWFVKIEEAIVTKIDGDNTTIAQGENTVNVFKIPSDIEYAVNDILTLTGNIGCFNTVQIVNPQNVEVQSNETPTITVDPISIDVPYDGEEGNISVTYENMETDDIEILFYTTAEATTTTTCSWIDAIFDEMNNVQYTIAANEGEARTAYMKVHGLDAEGSDVYSDLITITQAAGTGDQYALFNGELVEGDYIIYYDGKAMNTTVTSDRLQYEEVTPSKNVITTDNAAIVWHIAKSGDYWTIFNTDANAYAAGTGGKNKAQMLEGGTDDKALWTVSGTETYDFVNKANATANVNAYLRNNGTYGFACYAEGTGGALSLYKKVEAVAEDVTIDEADYVDEAYVPTEKYANVTFKRTLVEGWNGLVLPFDMTVEEAKTKFSATLVKDFTGVTYDAEKGATLVFSDATEIKAGKPFMIKSAAGTEYTFEGVQLKPDALQTISQLAGEAKYTMTGTYKKVDLTNENFVLIQGGNYYQHNTNKKSSAKAFRAYFLNESTGEALSKGINIDFNGEATGITLVEDAQNSMNGDIYNLQGQKVNHAQKGVYIVNGKKIVVK